MTTAPDPVRFVAPAAVLGGGFSRKSFARAMESRPDFVACDAGSTDWGPYYLGTGTSWSGYRQTRRDLEAMMTGTARAGVPLLIGSAGFTGSHSGLDWFRTVVDDVVADNDLDLTVAAFRSELTKDWLLERVRQGRVHPLDGRDALTEDDVRAATRVVAMMGPEPYATALEAGADVVLSARSSDAALYAAVPLMKGVAPGAAWHMGKVAECGYAIAEPIGAGECIVGSVDDEGFTVRPTGPRAVCTVGSVTAQMMYENASPHTMREPSGTLDTSAASYVQADDASVRVTGARFQEQPYTVRLEGVRQVGYRSICLFAVRDPAVVAHLVRFTDEIEQLVHATAEQRFGLQPGDYTFGFRRYGYDGVLGDLEPMARGRAPQGYEVALVAEAVCADQTTAHEVVSGCMPFFMHGVRVPGVKHSANGALAYAPNVLDTGPVFTWSVWHAAELDDPAEVFPLELHRVSAAGRVAL